MAFVAWISYQRSKGEVSSKDGYFLAGRNLGGFFIGGSLLLTNLSAEQLIGLNGSSYGANMSSMAWEVTAAVATIAMAVIFLPKYLAGAFTTLPQFLNDRFDKDVQRLSVLLFMLGYGLVTIPSVLYSGSIAVIKLFDVPTILGVGQFEALVITVITIGVVGSIYAVLGGLKAVAVSDTINGIGLLIVGAAVPTLGLIALGDGSFFSGLKTIASEAPEKLNAIGDAAAPTPFGTLFTGMILANLFYWCTNQYVIQRTLAARNLAERSKRRSDVRFFQNPGPILHDDPRRDRIPSVRPRAREHRPGLPSLDQRCVPNLAHGVLSGGFDGCGLLILQLSTQQRSDNVYARSLCTAAKVRSVGPPRCASCDDRQRRHCCLLIHRRAAALVCTGRTLADHSDFYRFLQYSDHHHRFGRAIHSPRAGGQCKDCDCVSRNRIWTIEVRIRRIRHDPFSSSLCSFIPDRGCNHAHLRSNPTAQKGVGIPA